jgi:hypothetical protein
LYGDISIGAKGSLSLEPGTYYINSISENAKGSLSITGPTTIYVKTDLDLGGQGVMNPLGDPTQLTVFYAGSNEMKMAGGSQAFVEVYAPNAPLKLVGTSDFFGSFVGLNVTIQGTPEIHYSTSSLNTNLLQRPFRIINWSQSTF